MTAGSLRRQVAVVTGANSGVGRSATEMLLRAGVHVTIICRSRDRGEQALAELRELAATSGGTAGLVPTVGLELADMSRLDDVRTAAARIAASPPSTSS